MVLVWRVAGKQERSGLSSIPAETVQSTKDERCTYCSGSEESGDLAKSSRMTD